MGERYTNVHTSSDVTLAAAVEQRYISVSEATRRLNALQAKADLLDEAVGLLRDVLNPAGMASSLVAQRNARAFLDHIKAAGDE